MLVIFIGLCSIKFVIMAILYARERNWKPFLANLAVALTGGLLAFLIGADYIFAAKILLRIIAICCAVLAVKCFQKKNYTVFVLGTILTILLLLVAYLI